MLWELKKEQGERCRTASSSVSFEKYRLPFLFWSFPEGQRAAPSELDSKFSRSCSIYKTVIAKQEEE
jgi:hypothetical protein